MQNQLGAKWLTGDNTMASPVGRAIRDKPQLKPIFAEVQRAQTDRQSSRAQYT